MRVLTILQVLFVGVMSDMYVLWDVVGTYFLVKVRESPPTDPRTRRRHDRAESERLRRLVFRASLRLLSITR